MDASVSRGYLVTSLKFINNQSTLGLNSPDPFVPWLLYLISEELKTANACICVMFSSTGDSPQCNFGGDAPWLALHKVVTAYFLKSWPEKNAAKLKIKNWVQTSNRRHGLLNGHSWLALLNIHTTLYYKVGLQRLSLEEDTEATGKPRDYCNEDLILE